MTADSGERIADDNGDELEHGQPDFPGQFPEPAPDEARQMLIAERDLLALAREFDRVNAATASVIDPARLARAIHETKGGGPFGVEGSCECMDDAEAIAVAYRLDRKP